MQEMFIHLYIHILFTITLLRKITKSATKSLVLIKDQFKQQPTLEGVVCTSLTVFFHKYSHELLYSKFSNREPLTLKYCFLQC